MNQKFRAIIKDIGTLYFDFESLVRHPHPIFIIRLHVLPWLRLGNQPDRFTGLCDKNNREIYENDITNYGLVKYFNNLSFDTDGAKHPGFYFENKLIERYGCNDLDYHIGFFDNIEILGNVHESPELLGGKDAGN